MSDAWTVQEAKAQLSELLRRARAGEPQRIGLRAGACVLISAKAWEALQTRRLGAWLVESAPRGCEFETPPRSTRRAEPFGADTDTTKRK